MANGAEDIVLPDGSTVEVDPDDMSVEVDGLGSVTVHTNKADARLIMRFKKPVYRAILRALAEECQEAENMLWQVLLSRYVDHAFGKSLDYIGNRVGEPRASLNDPDYRVRIKARILINRSCGRAEDILLIIRALGGNGVVRNTRRASMRVQLLARPANGSTRRQIASLLGEATSGGVSLHVSVPTSSPIFKLGCRATSTGYGGKLASASATVDDAGYLTDGRIT
jgi:hypothetical protein